MATSTSAPMSALLSRPTRLSRHWCHSLPALLALAACGASTANQPTRATQVDRYPRPAAAVHVFTTPPGRPYLELEILQTSYRPRYSPAERERYLAVLVEEAGRKGCDGLILNGPGPMVTMAGTGASYRPYDDRPLTGLWGTCIAFVDEDRDL